MHDTKDRNRTAVRLQTYFACLLLLGASACSGSEETPPGGGDDDDKSEEMNPVDQDDDVGDDDTGEPPAQGDDDEDDDTTPPSTPPKQDAGPNTRLDGGPNTRLDGGSMTPPSSADASKPDAKSDGGTTGPVTGGENASQKREPSVGPKGPYTVKSYTMGLEEPAYSSSIMYYPENAEGTIGAVAFSPGFTATKESYSYLGDLLASNGIAILLTSPTSTSDQPPARGADLQAAVMKLKAENTREGSPLKGKLNGKVCITGHSMGGGGTLIAANALGTQIACSVPLQPWQPGGSFAKIMAPTLFIGAQNDTIASVSSNAQPHYSSIPASVEKILAVVSGVDHFYSSNRNNDHTVEAYVMVAWYHVHLDGDDRYREYLYGAKKGMGFSTYTTSKMQ